MGTRLRKAQEDAVAAALGRSRTPSEAAAEAGVEVADVWRLLRHEAFMRRVLALRPKCGGCLGTGACPCADCWARRAEERAARGVDSGMTFTDGRTCHVCGGTGRSPVRDDSTRVLRARKAWTRARAGVVEVWVAEHGPV